MHIIELSELQFRNYAKVHSKRNIYQTVEYINMLLPNYNGKYYLGLVDENNNLVAATALLYKNLRRKNYYGYAPGGFLIDFNNFYLIETFTKELTLFLKKKKFVFLKLNPLFIYKEYDKKGNLLGSNISTFKNLVDNLKYIHLGFNKDFEGNFSRFNVLLEAIDINETYKKISRSARRNIEECLKMGVTIHRGDILNVELFYSMIRKKSLYNIDYYKDYFKNFSTSDNSFELYFAKINPKTYINNFQYLYDKELKKNTKLTKKIRNLGNSVSQIIINKKILSDRTLENYKMHIVKATKIYQEFPNGLVIGTCAIVKNNREINFIIDGYEEKFRSVYSSYLIKWEIIKKYINEGYTNFNLGEITSNIKKENNKFYGLYLSKSFFNGKIIEYPGEFDLIINKFSYSWFYNKMYYKNKKVIKEFNKNFKK